MFHGVHSYWSVKVQRDTSEDAPEIVEEVGVSSIGDYVPQWMFKSRTEEPPWDDGTGQEMDGARHPGLGVYERLLVEWLGGATRWAIAAADSRAERVAGSTAADLGRDRGGEAGRGAFVRGRAGSAGRDAIAGRRSRASVQPKAFPQQRLRTYPATTPPQGSCFPRRCLGCWLAVQVRPTRFDERSQNGLKRLTTRQNA